MFNFDKEILPIHAFYTERIFLLTSLFRDSLVKDKDTNVIHKNHLMFFFPNFHDFL